jgi:FtsP/CotA-like multicopper oxidase with cupredoxin domain
VAEEVGDDRISPSESHRASRHDPMSRALRPRFLLPVLASVVVVAPLAWLCLASLLPGSYSVLDMGRPDHGGAHPAGDGHGPHGSPRAARPVSELVADPHRRADARFDLVARQQRLTVGRARLAGFTVNGSSPGPELRVRQGQLVEVRLRNESVAEGVTLHWHGLDVPNAMDGVAGVTQDAVPPGGTFTYRFVADQAGSYWYHAHQVSNPQVAGGLFGPLVVVPRAGIPQQQEVVALAHTYAGVRTINGVPGDLHQPARPGERVRLRVTNTDNGAMQVWASEPYRVVAVDGTDLHGPTPVRGQALTLTSGGRADLEVLVPSSGAPVRVQLSRATAVVLGPAGSDVPVPPQPDTELDLLSYGAPAPTGIDPARATRRFDYVIDRRPGFVRGRPGMWWAINGGLYPDTPAFMVREGDLVTMRIVNRSSEVHPMHLHGHHLVVLARDGVPATGSPWWADSLDVMPRQSYEVAFVADNPGIWMDHCHNLKHAADGMVAHLMYEGVDTPYRIGRAAGNQPE